jgi:hypothetical protein
MESEPEKHGCSEDDACKKGYSLGVALFCLKPS